MPVVDLTGALVARMLRRIDRIIDRLAGIHETLRWLAPRLARALDAALRDLAEIRSALVVMHRAAERRISVEQASAEIGAEREARRGRVA